MMDCKEIEFKLKTFGLWRLGGPHNSWLCLSGDTCLGVRLVLTSVTTWVGSGLTSPTVKFWLSCSVRIGIEWIHKKFFENLG